MLTGYDPSSRALHLMGLYEREIYPYLLHGMKRGRVLIDIGANDGYYALAFVRMPGKQVVLCEPGDERMELEKNLALNGFHKQVDYELVDKFVSANPGPDQIELASLMKVDQENFVLMDIEGGELGVIKNFNFSSNLQVSWLIETHAKEIEDEIVARLKQHQYKVTIIDRAWWRPLVPEKRPLMHNRWLYAEQ